ncbi:MAG: TetR/AcrR family transcriptional regulator [Actinobacteria bacterium]|nr:TetR/AcrR family transcriptional regulator [Actinomycetota bacterium]
MNTVQPARKRGVRAEVPITRDIIVTTAFRLIEERGLEQFSMRSLATELGVFPATLYWHVGDRSQLLGMVEFRWIEQVELPDHLTDWREWMAELARRYRRNAHEHPNVARLASLERARNNESLLIPDAIVGTLVRMGVGDQLVHAYNALMGAVRGFVVMELAPRAEPDAASDVEEDLRALDPEQFPNITEHFDEMADQALSMRWSNAAEHPLDDSFEFLVKVLLDGLAAQLPRTRK